MTKTMTLGEVFVVGRPTPFAPAEHGSFEALFGAAAPGGYLDVLARFGVDASFCGRLHVMTPEQCRKDRESRHEGARKAGLSSYFHPSLWQNFDDSFAAADGPELVPLASSIDAENLVLLPGRDEIYYVPSPRSFGSIEVAGTDAVTALDHFRRRHEHEIPFLLCKSGMRRSTHHVGDSRDWTEVLFQTTAPELVDESTWNYFYPQANAVVTLVGDADVVIHSGAQGSAYDEFVSWILERLASEE